MGIRSAKLKGQQAVNAILVASQTFAPNIGKMVAMLRRNQLFQIRQPE
jgi:hypothetical protein